MKEKTGVKVNTDIEVKAGIKSSTDIKTNTCRSLGQKIRQKSLIRLTAMLLILVMTLCTGCGQGKQSDIRIVKPLSDTELFKIDEEICTVSEAVVLISAQKKVVEDIYGPEIWAVETGGVTFEENMKVSLKDFLARMTCMKLMAEANHITLSAEEKQQIQSCTDAYLSQLTEEENKALNAEKEEIQDVFTSYYYYNKLMEVLTSDMETEISDNDARIMQIECIYVAKTDKDQTSKMQKILKKAKEADSFAEVAKTYNESGETAMSISRNQLPAEVEEAVFALSDDQISNVLEAEDGYYIVHCVEDYDREATAKHKEELVNALKEEYFTQQYDGFVENLTAQFNDSAWEKISLADIVTLSEADFFAIYEEYVK